MIWATIWRDGKSDEAFNDVLRGPPGRSRLRLVEWAAIAQAHPDWLAGDHLHGNETGYRERARAVAAAGDDIVCASREPDCAVTRIVQLTRWRR